MYEPLRCYCDNYKCKNPVISSDDEEEDGYLLDPMCLLCEKSMCKEHAHFVRETSKLKEFVCDRCYQTCMIAAGNELYAEMLKGAAETMMSFHKICAEQGIKCDLSKLVVKQKG